MTEMTVSGPVFDGRAVAASEALLAASERAVAEYAVNAVRARLGEVLRHPTGYYESQIQTNRQANDQVVTDGGVIYGPWLEGVGSRNQTTRFKGYFTFREVTQDVAKAAGDVAGELVTTYVREMNA